MTHAYDESYLEDAMRNMGAMAHFCINEYGMTPEQFSDAFLSNIISEQIAKGNPKYLVGYSGKELADRIVSDTPVSQPTTDNYSITPEYWAGWALAYYQWYTSKTFQQISSDGMTFPTLLSMYHPYHEADLSKLLEAIG